jgi:hypothetical protein
VSGYKSTAHQDFWIWALAVTASGFAMSGVQALAEHIDFVPFTLLLGFIFFAAFSKIATKFFPMEIASQMPRHPKWKHYGGMFIGTMGLLALAAYQVFESADAPLGHRDRLHAFNAGGLLLGAFLIVRAEMKFLSERKFL